MTPLTFALGQTVMTPGVADLAARGILNPVDLLARHAGGDWGDIAIEDRGLNEQALLVGARVFSVYKVAPAVTVWIITEADRAATTLLLPDEY